MSSLILRGYSNKQPQGAVNIAWDNSLTERLGLLATPSGNGFNTTPPVITGGSTISPSVLGLTAKTPDTVSPGAIFLSAILPVNITGDFTVMLYGVGGNSVTTETAYFTRSGGTLGSTFFAVGGANARVTLDNNAGTAVTTLDPDIPHIIIARRKGNQNQLFIDGVYIGQAVTGTRVGTFTGFGFGRSGGSNNAAVNRHDALGAVWSRVLSDDEIKLLSQNPWQLFAPKKRVIYFNAAAGGGVVTKTATLSSLLQKLQTKTISTDALLLRQSITRNASLSAQIAKNLIKTTGNDAILLKAIQRQLQADANILKTLQTSANISAALQKLNVNYTSFDGILIAASGIQAVLDAIVQKGSLLNSQCDAKISKVFETYCSASAQLQKEMFAQPQFQAVLQKKQSAAAAMDSILILFGVTAVSTNLQALLQKSALLRTTNITSMLQKAQVSSTSLEAILTQLSGVTAELSALLQKNKIVFTDMNAALQKALQKTMVFSAILANLNLITLSLDAVLIQGELVFTANRTNTIFLQQEIRIVILENEIRIIPVER